MAPHERVIVGSLLPVLFPRRVPGFEPSWWTEPHIRHFSSLVCRAAEGALDVCLAHQSACECMGLGLLFGLYVLCQLAESTKVKKNWWPACVLMMGGGACLALFSRERD